MQFLVVRLKYGEKREKSVENVKKSETFMFSIIEYFMVFRKSLIKFIIFRKILKCSGFFPFLYGFACQWIFLIVFLDIFFKSFDRKYLSITIIWFLNKVFENIVVFMVSLTLLRVDGFSEMILELGFES